MQRRQWHYCCNYNSTMTTMALMRWCCLFHGRRINHINGCNARRAINIQWGWGVYFNDVPNIWTRRPTHEGIIVILGRALVVYLRTVCCCWWVQLPIIIMWMISFKSKAWNDRLTLQKGRCHGAWRLPIAAVDVVLGTIVKCRVDGDIGAAAMRVVKERMIGRCHGGPCSYRCKLICTVLRHLPFKVRKR